MNNLKENLHNVRARVALACESAGRNPIDIAILAVSKKHPAQRIHALQQLPYDTQQLAAFAAYVVQRNH